MGYVYLSIGSYNYPVNKGVSVYLKKVLLTEKTDNPISGYKPKTAEEAFGDIIPSAESKQNEDMFADIANKSK